MKSFSGKALLAGLLIGTALVGCKKEPSEDVSFNKEEMLTNIADNRIIPALDDFADKINTLEASFIVFSNDLSTVNLDAVRANWKDSYLSWQNIKIYDFGPVRDYGLKNATGTFPCEPSIINSNITNGGYNLGSSDNVEAIGLPALDYLLHRPDALNYFIGNDPYTTYALEIIQKMKNEVALVQSAWTSYRGTFIASSGTESTSSFSKLVNEFNRDYELAKNAKLGFPIGKQTLGVQGPEYIEARNSGISLELFRASIANLKSAYTGGSGKGFDDYLLQLGRTALNTDIVNNFDDILDLTDGLNGTLESEMANNVSGLDALYNKTQGQVVNLKTDMTGAFGVIITYNDGDGD